MDSIVFMLLLLPVTLRALDATTFNVLWNVPTIQCRKTYAMDFGPLLKNYGILVNKGDEFKGDVNAIFYESQLGFYPHLNQTDYPVYGGIPQMGNLSEHLKKAREDIDKVIPNTDFNGLGIIDWESWRPVWNFNWGTLRKYQEESFKLEQSQHPRLSNSSLLKLAQKEWETSAKDFMLKTLRLAQKMRPHALWCYYLFPDCYNYEGQTPQDFKCPPIVIKGNNELRWLWDEIKAVCPSLYVVDGYLKKYTFNQRTWYVNGRLQEALRVAPKSELYPYVGYGYGLTPGSMVPEDDFWRILAQAASTGASGAVIWGASATLKSRSTCQLLETYVQDVIGPAVSTVKANTEQCAKTVCNNNGRCTWPNDPNVVAWKLYLDKGKSTFQKDDIMCRCTKGFSGRYCNMRERLANDHRFRINLKVTNKDFALYSYMRKLYGNYL